MQCDARDVRSLTNCCFRAFLDDEVLAQTDLGFYKLCRMDDLTLEPAVLEWAAGQAGESLDSLAQVIAKRTKDRARVLEGHLTSPQAEKVAKITGVPFGLLFLKQPPVIEQSRIPDLRQTVGAEPLGREFQETLEDVVRKQQWYIDFLQERGGKPVEFVGKFDASKRPSSVEIARDISNVLGLTPALRKTAASQDDYFSKLADKAEQAGALVIKSGIVKSSTRRPLPVSQFRGFALVDKLVPVVFINGRDAAVASVFTLVHELAHLWIGQSGVSYIAHPELSGVERLCNRVAAEVLVPQAEFTAAWATLKKLLPSD